MTQNTHLYKVDDQDVAQLTNFEDPDLDPPAFIEPAPDSENCLGSLDPTSQSVLRLPVPSDAKLDFFTSSASIKRSADDDPGLDSTKRVKASHHPSIPAPITIPASHLSHPYFLETPTSQTPYLMSGDLSIDSPMDDHLATPHQVGSRDTPAVPVEAIETLQQASADMLQALVRKDAVDREKQLRVAVGTMRTCLDIEFIPYLDAWKEEAKSIRITSEVSSVRRTSKKLTIGTSGPPRKSRDIRKRGGHRTSAGTPTGPRDLEASKSSEPVRDTLPNQLAIARATVQRQEQIIKDKENQLARSTEENKRLRTHLAKAKVQASIPIKPIKPVPPPVPDLSNAVSALNKVIDEQTGKLDRQKKYIQELEGRNASLLQKSVTPLPSKPVVNKVDPQVAIMKKTINEQAGRIGRQKEQLTNLEKQNTKLKNQANLQPSPGKSRREDQMEVDNGKTRVDPHREEQKDMKKTLGNRSGSIRGHQTQRQIPPDLISKGEESGSIATNEVDPTFLKSVEILIASMSKAGRREEHTAGPRTATTASPDTGDQLRSRTGANQIDVNGRSLWDRMGGRRAVAEGGIGRGGAKIVQTQRREEGEIPSFSGGPEEESPKQKDGSAPCLLEEDGWGNSTSVRVGEGAGQLRDKVYVPLVPGRHCDGDIQD